MHAEILRRETLLQRLPASPTIEMQHVTAWMIAFPGCQNLPECVEFGEAEGRFCVWFDYCAHEETDVVIALLAMGTITSAPVHADAGGDGKGGVSASDAAFARCRSEIEVLKSVGLWYPDRCLEIVRSKII